jgi:hypothetical protein
MPQNGDLPDDGEAEEKGETKALVLNLTPSYKYVFQKIFELHFKMLFTSINRNKVLIEK